MRDFKTEIGYPPCEKWIVILSPKRLSIKNPSLTDISRYGNAAFVPVLTSSDLNPLDIYFETLLSLIPRSSSVNQ